MMFSACTKNNQSCINKLDGEWEEFSTDVYINGTLDPLGKPGTLSYIFNPYKDKNNEVGTATLKTVLGTSSITQNIDYQISKDCTEFWWSTTDTTDTDDVRANINQLTNNTFQFEYDEQQGLDLYRYIITLNKQ